MLLSFSTCYTLFRNTGQVSGATSPLGSLPWSVRHTTLNVLHGFSLNNFLSTESLITKLFSLAQQEGGVAPPNLIHIAFKFLYLISKVRGAKVVVRWFSHEVADLQPVLQLLQKQDMQDHEVCDVAMYKRVYPLFIVPLIRLGRLAIFSFSGSPSFV